MSGAMVAISGGSERFQFGCRHEYQHSGKPWQRSTVGPPPCFGPVHSNAICLDKFDARSSLPTSVRSSHIVSSSTTEVAPPTPVERRTAQNDMLYEFNFRARNRASGQHRRKVGFGVRREKGGAFQWVQSHPATAPAGSNRSSHGGDEWLKPSVSVSRIGDSASVQAVTRVNAEQASKRTMRRPTRQPFRGKADTAG